MNALEIFKIKKVQNQIDAILMDLKKLEKPHLNINIDKIESQGIIEIDHLYQSKPPWNITTSQNEYLKDQETDKTN